MLKVRFRISNAQMKKVNENFEQQIALWTIIEIRAFLREYVRREKCARV